MEERGEARRGREGKEKGEMQLASQKPTDSPHRSRLAGPTTPLLLPPKSAAPIPPPLASAHFKIRPALPSLPPSLGHPRPKKPCSTRNVHANERARPS